jgi:hypothetical protein
MKLGMKLGYKFEQGKKLVDQLTTYRVGEGLFQAPTDVENFSLSTWWRDRAGLPNDELVKIARLLADIVPHSAGIERMFSVMGWLHSDTRNRLNVATVKSLATVKMDAQGSSR